jgi:hypothetical protein
MQASYIDIFNHHRIVGWAADNERPNDRLLLRIMVDGAEQGRVVADKPREGLRLREIYGDGAHGFEYRFDPPLSPLRGYDVVIGCVDSSGEVPGGRLRIEPKRAQDLGLRPLLVSATGRSGTTLLMHRLGGDRGIAIANRYPFEMKLLTYYAHAFEILTMASSVKERLSMDDLAANPRQLDINPMHHPESERSYPEAAMIYDFFGRRSAARLTTAFRDIIEDFYQDMRLQAHKFSARFFAEKCDVFTPARGFAKLAYQGVKEILLVRDPRDIHCSRRAFWSDSTENSIQNLRSVQATVLPIWRADANDLIVVRYEDLVQNPAETMSRIATYLELDHPIELNMAGERQIFSGHGTSSDPAASIGRWRQELSKEEQTSLSLALRPYLEAFGYEAS